jgi:hypothetical protein
VAISDHSNFKRQWTRTFEVRTFEIEAIGTRPTGYCSAVKKETSQKETGSCGDSVRIGANPLSKGNKGCRSVEVVATRRCRGIGEEAFRDSVGGVPIHLVLSFTGRNDSALPTAVLLGYRYELVYQVPVDGLTVTESGTRNEWKRVNCLRGLFSFHWFVSEESGLYCVCGDIERT